MIDDDKFDAIISDYDMPEMDGLEFFKALKEQGKDIFFIVFTGSGPEVLTTFFGAVDDDFTHRHFPLLPSLRVGATARAHGFELRSNIQLCWEGRRLVR